MAMLLKGADAARALTEQLREQAEELKKNGTEPCLAILRVGAREDDLSYERGALKRCEKVGITVRQVGWGSFSSFSFSERARARFPPAESPKTMMLLGSQPPLRSD